MGKSIFNGLNEYCQNILSTRLDMLESRSVMIPVVKKLDVRHPKHGQMIPVRVVNLQNNTSSGCNFGRFQYELPHEDSMYMQMISEMNRFYIHLTRRGDTILYQELMKIGYPVVVNCPDDGSFKRAELVSNPRYDKVDSLVSVILLDEDGPVKTVRLESLFHLDSRFKELPPRWFRRHRQLSFTLLLPNHISWMWRIKRFFSLGELQLYQDTEIFRKILETCSEEFFAGKNTVAEFLNVDDDVYADKSSDCALVYIYGVNYKYPKEKFSLGLSEIIIGKIIEQTNELNLPKEQFQRQDCLLLGGKNNGNVFISFNTLLAEHLLRRLEKVNNLTVSEIQENFKSHPDLPLSKTGIYLALSESDNCYYRAKYIKDCEMSIQLMEKDPKVLVLLIDFGTVENVAIKYMILVKDFDVLLEMLPPMAIEVHLAGVEFMTPKKLPSIIDPSELCAVKTLRTGDATNLAEVQLQHLQLKPNVCNFRTINEEIVAKYGRPCPSPNKCAQEIQVLSKPVQHRPSTYKRSVSCDIDTRQLIWSGIEEQTVLLKPGNVYQVEMTTTPKDPKNVVLISTKRRHLLEQLEDSMMQTRMIPWKRARQNRTFMETKLCNFFSYWWQEEEKVTRVRILESWEHLSALQLLSIDRNQFLNVFLIDYGIKKQVSMQDLSVLDEEHCRYPPFAVSSSITSPKAYAPLLPKDLNGKTFNIRVEDISFDEFDIPHAEVRIMDFNRSIISPPKLSQ